MKSTTFNKISGTLTTVQAKLATLDVESFAMVQLLVRNTGMNPISGFTINGKVTRFYDTNVGPEGADTEYTQIKSGSYDVPDFYILNCEGDPASLAAGASALITVNTQLLQHLRLVAKSANADTTVEVLASGWSE